MELSDIHPVNFFGEKPIRSEDIGKPEVYPILQEIQHMNIKDENNKSLYIEDILRDFIINNVTNLSNTFMIKLLEDNIDKNELFYIADFDRTFDLKTYLFNSLSKTTLSSKDSESICNIILSNIIFSLNQFTQFYITYKLIYDQDGINLHKYLYKLTYDEDPSDNIKEQDKYAFCYSIMSNIIESLIPDIKDCCNLLESSIKNIKILSTGGIDKCLKL